MKDLMIESRDNSVEVSEKEYLNDDDWANDEDPINECRWTINDNEPENVKKAKFAELVALMNDSDNCVNCFIHSNWASATSAKKRAMINYIKMNIIENEY